MLFIIPINISPAMLAEIIANDVFTRFHDMFERLVEKFNSSNENSVRKEAIEQIGIFRQVVFPKCGEFFHANVAAIFPGEVLHHRFIVSDGDIVIEQLIKGTCEYETQKRIKLSSIKLKLEVVYGKNPRDDFDFVITVN